MSVGLIAVIIGSALGTALISGIFGMIGGMILMGIYATLFTVTSAMILHGVTQLASNGSRVFLYQKHILWRHVRYYLMGSCLAMAAFAWIRFIPSRGVLFMTLGSLPFLMLLPLSPKLDGQKPHHAVLCGGLVTISQLTGGASGPLLDIFYVRSPMTRFQNMGTKAFTQSIGHFLKLSYFATVAWMSPKIRIEFSPWIIFPCISLALVGAVIGKQIVQRLSDLQFQRYTHFLVLGVGLIYILRGLQELFL